MHLHDFIKMICSYYLIFDVEFLRTGDVEFDVFDMF